MKGLAVRNVIACSTCVLWITERGVPLAGTPHAEMRSTKAECRRRPQPGADGLRPQPPEVPGNAGCSEGVPLPAPKHYPKNCADCRYWRPRRGADEGLCIAWAPRWSAGADGATEEAIGKYAYRVTPREFFCGDGVSVSYVDPEALQG